MCESLAFILGECEDLRLDLIKVIVCIHHVDDQVVYAFRVLERACLCLDSRVWRVGHESELQ